MELLLDLKKRYTYADYLTWADDKVRELIDGFIKFMAPVASSKHQEISVSLSAEFRFFLKKNKGKCKIYHDMNVRLPKNGETEDNKIYDVVLPDICIICDPSKVDKNGCIGAPDLVVEIQSFSTAKYDLTTKFNLYESAGVREYWIVYPYDEAIEVFLLQSDGKFDDGKKYSGGTVPVNIFNGYQIDFNDIF